MSKKPELSHRTIRVLAVYSLAGVADGQMCGSSAGAGFPPVGNHNDDVQHHLELATRWN